MSLEQVKKQKEDEKYFQRLKWFLDNELRLPYQISTRKTDGIVDSVLVSISQLSLGFSRHAKTYDLFYRYPKVFGRMREVAWKDGLTHVSQVYETSSHACVEFTVDRSWVGKTIGVLRMLYLI